MAQNESRVSRPFVVGIDARAAVETKAGRGRVVRELLRALAKRDDPNTYRCYCRTPWEPLGPRFEWVPVRGPDPLWHARASVAASRECDVFLSTNSYLTAIMVRVPSVTVVYDLMALDPGTQPNRRSAIVERLTLRAAVCASERLWCISESTAGQLLARYPRARNKIAVVPLAVSPRLSSHFADGGSRLPNPGFVLAVGTLEPRKNLPRMVEAYASLPSALRDGHPLVVVGARGWRTAATLESLRSLGEQCRLLDHVSDDDLGELYRRCSVFCYPSLGEGFGLPVLEAMAAGAPVVTSNVSSLPEVGGDAVEYVDPRSADSIANGLAHLLRSPERRAELASRGRARAAIFSWDATASAVGELLQAAVVDRTMAAERRMRCPQRDLERARHRTADLVAFVLFGLAHGRRSFTFAGGRYRYHAAVYNGTFGNERTVELAIALALLARNGGKRVLEVGNVTRHYVSAAHRVVDKHETAPDVENADVVEIQASEPYDLILSISTLEHVGFDELSGNDSVGDPEKPGRALEHLTTLLAPGGTLLVTFGLGYNPSLDERLFSGELGFDEVRFLKRISRDNRWREAAAEEVRCARYGFPYPAANAVAIGLRRGHGPHGVDGGRPSSSL